VRFRDPFGVPLELFYGPSVSHEPFHSPIALSHFVTGELGLGHCLFLTPDLETTTRFYTDVIGFEVSDTAFGPWRGHMLAASFLNGNLRHHSIAFAEVPGPIQKFTTHFELHLPTIDDVGRAYDRTIAAGVPLSNTLGRHTDGVISFYAQTPSGFDFELGTEGYLVGKDWKTQHLSSYVVWGHQFVGEAA
jgi:2,3-dihydroxybiphenyl 1,2-dioxygenase